MKEIKVKESSIFKRVLSAKQDPGNLIRIFSVSGMNVSSVSRIRIVQYLLRIRGNTGRKVLVRTHRVGEFFFFIYDEGESSYF